MGLASILEGITAPAAARTKLGGTTVGQNFFTLANPSAISFPRINADNSLDALSASDFRTAIGAGTGGGNALTANPLSQFAATTSAQLRGVLSDEINGTGGLALFGNQAVSSDSTPSFSTVTATTFIGDLTGDITGDATSCSGNSETVTVNDVSSDTTTWVLLGRNQSGAQSPCTDSALTYNANSNALTATTFIGSLTGNAATATILATTRAIYGNSFDGSAALDQIIASTYGGTGNGFTKFSGPTTAERTFTLPDASSTILTSNAAVTVAQGGTGLATLTANNVMLGNGTSTPSFVAPGTSGNVLTSNGTTWTSAAAAGGAQTPWTANVNAAGFSLIGNTTAAGALTLQSTSGVGTTDTIVFKVGNNGATTAAKIDTSGNFGLGITPLFKLHVHTDGASNEIVTSSAHSAPIPYVVGLSSGGTAASPTASQTDHNLLVMTGRGYGDNAFTTGNRGSLIFKAAENWTNSAQGTYITLSATAIGGTATGEKFRIDGTGNNMLGTTTKPAGAVFNFVLGGGSTSVLGAATADAVCVAAVDKAAGDRRLYMQSELGSSISLGNDRLNFAATTGLISIGGTDVISSTSSATTLSMATTASERLTCSKFFLWDGGRFVTTQFDAVATTTLATITGLSCTIVSGKKYAFEAWLDMTLAAAGGGKWAISGAATMTAITYNIREETYSVTPTIALNARGTALDTAHTVTGVNGSCMVRIVGACTCNAGGTFLLQFAEQTASGTGSVLVNSWFRVFEVQ